ncbi:MAG: hypothetical protein JNM24_19055 [Bdellovibrionaceae bacterium]|nr:hypothetical protein [Pseudobdellovibrionaceae bacterium]
MNITTRLFMLMTIVCLSSSTVLADADYTSSDGATSTNLPVKSDVKKSPVSAMKDFIAFDGNGRFYKGTGSHKGNEQEKECMVYIGNVRTNYSSAFFHTRVLYSRYNDRYVWFEGASASKTKGNRFEITTVDSNPDGIGFSAVYGVITVDKNDDGTIKSVYSNSRYLWNTFWLKCENLIPSTIEEYQKISNDTDDMIY